MQSCCPPFDLTPLASPEMNPRAVPDLLFAYLGCEVAPMYFDPADAFNLNDHPKTWNLPDSAVALLSRAGEWSARNHEHGFVPADMLARFCSDPVQAVEELCRRRLWQRVKGGYQFTDWGLVGETAEQKAEKEADAAAKRSYDAERQRKSRANRKAAHAGKIRAGAGVTGDVTGMSHVTSGDMLIDRSDQDQSIGAGQSNSGARTRESPELVTAVADAICAKVGFVPTDNQAREVIAVIRERALKAGRRIRNPLAYIPASVANEPDLWDGLLLAAPPPIAELAPPSDSWDPAHHPYDPSPATGVCRCGYTKTSPRHNTARSA